MPGEMRRRAGHGPVAGERPGDLRLGLRVSGRLGVLGGSPEPPGSSGHRNRQAVNELPALRAFRHARFDSGRSGSPVGAVVTVATRCIPFARAGRLRERGMSAEERSEKGQAGNLAGSSHGVSCGSQHGSTRRRGEGGDHAQTARRLAMENMAVMRLPDFNPIRKSGPAALRENPP